MDESSGVQRSEYRDGVEFILPPRVLPRALPWILLVMGIFVTLFMFVWMGGPDSISRHSAAGAKAPALNPGDWMRLAFSLLGLPGLAGGLGLLMVGTLLLFSSSRCRVAVDERALRLRESLGPVHWSWTVARADLRGLSIGGNGVTGGTGTAGTFQALLARRAGRKDLALAIGYGPAVLQALSVGLAEALRGGGVEVPMADDPRLGPPPGNLEVEEDGARIAISFPRPWRPWPLIVFALAWLAACAFFIVRLVESQWIAPAHPQEGAAAIVPVILLAVMCALGIAILLSCIDSGWRRTSLLWDGAVLSLIRRSPLRRSLETWNRDQLADVAVEERGSGSGRYQALAVTPRMGRPRDLPLRGDPIAMAWVAARLRLLALGRAPELPGPAAAAQAAAGGPPPGPAALLPPGSAILIVPERAGVEITFPARGLISGSHGMVLMGAVFMAISIGIGVLFSIQKHDTPSIVGVVACVAAFFAAGGALAVSGARIGTRRTVVRLDAVELSIEARDCLGGRRQVLPRAQLAGIRVEDSAIEINNRKLRRLALVPQAGKALTCATGWQGDELEAVAGALRAALG